MLARGARACTDLEVAGARSAAGGSEWYPTLGLERGGLLREQPAPPAAADRAYVAAR